MNRFLTYTDRRTDRSGTQRWVALEGGNRIVHAHPRLGASAPDVHLWPKPRWVVERPRFQSIQIRGRRDLGHDGRAALRTEPADDRQSAFVAYVLEGCQSLSLSPQAPLRQGDEYRKG